LGIVGTPNGESIAKLLSTKTRQSRGIEEIPPRTPLTIEHCNPKIEPLYSRIWEGIKGKRTTKGSHIHPPPNSQEKGPEIAPRKPPREGSENHQKEQKGTTHPILEEPRRIIYTSQRVSYKV
jgi:hypothetical protein